MAFCSRTYRTSLPVTWNSKDKFGEARKEIVALIDVSIPDAFDPVVKNDPTNNFSYLKR
jgi:hypothetical protein